MVFVFLFLTYFTHLSCFCPCFQMMHILWKALHPWSSTHSGKQVGAPMLATSWSPDFPWLFLLKATSACTPVLARAAPPHQIWLW